MADRQKDDLTIGLAALVLTGVVAGAGFFTWFSFGLGCALNDSGGPLNGPCAGPLAHLSLIGAGVAAAAWVGMALARSAGVYWCGTGLAVALTVAHWLLWSHP